MRKPSRDCVSSRLLKQDQRSSGRDASVRFLFLLFLFTAPLLAAEETPPIQQWIDEAIKAGGGIVTIPEGEHVLTHGLVIKNAKKLALRGINKETCVLKLSIEHQTEPIIEINGSAEMIEVAKLTLRGRMEAGVKSSALLSIRDKPEKPVMKGLIVRDCLFANFTTGVEVFAASSFQIERCSLSDGQERAVLFHQIKEGTAKGNRIARVTGAAFELRDASGCIIAGNETRDCDYGVIIQPESHPKSEAHQILNNAFFQNRVSVIYPAHIQPEPILKENDSE